MRVLDVEEFPELAGQNIHGPLALNNHDQVEARIVFRAISHQTNHFVAAPAQATEHSKQSAFLIRQLELQHCSHLCSPSIMAELEPPGGTSGQTFASCSIGT